MNNNPSVFISYTHENVDTTAIEFFVEELLHHANSRLDIFRDTSHLKPGQKISKYEENIRTVDCVVVLFTPEYLERIVNRKGGAYREFKLLLDRMSETMNGSTDTLPSEKFMVIPIVFSGTENTSIPDEFKDLKYENFSRFVVTSHPRTKSPIISDEVKSAHGPKFQRICSVINFSEIERSDEFETLKNDFMQILLFETKHEVVKKKFEEENFDELTEKIFVKTQSFQSAYDQNRIILIGRKGSGKSTIAAQIHRKREKTYKSNIDLHVDKFNLNMIGNLIYTQKFASDINSIISQDRFFSLIWLHYIYLQSMKILLQDSRNGSHVVDISASVSVIERKLSDLQGESSGGGKVQLENYWPDFVWIVGKIVNLVEVAIKQARTDEPSFHSDMASFFDVDNISNELFGKELFHEFRCCVDKCKRKFLFTLNGFDTEFDSFRVETQRRHLPEDEVIFRNQLEIDWLRGLLHSVLDMRTGITALASKIDFCLTVPKDRFVEVRQTERDDYRYRNLAADIKWTAIELALLLNKRIETINDFEPKKPISPIERFDYAMSKAYPEIPLRIEFQYGNVRISTSLFVYLLRHTFWRPRDLMFLLAQIVTTMKLLRKRRRKMNVEIIRKAVARATYGIVRSEFINEFQSVCINIRTIISTFQRCDNIVDYANLEKRIGKLNFEFVDSRFAVTTSMPEKVKFLFEIGFLGFSKTTENPQSNPFLWFFSDGDDEFDSLDDKEKKVIEYAIHPVFNDYLRLKIDEGRTISYYSDSYLEDNDAIH